MNENLELSWDTLLEMFDACAHVRDFLGGRRERYYVIDHNTAATLASSPQFETVTAKFLATAELEKNGGQQALSQPSQQTLWDLLCQALRRAGAYLVTIVANDERWLDDGTIALYYWFSHPTKHISPTDLERKAQLGRDHQPLDDHFLLIKYLLASSSAENGANGYQPYLSIRTCFEGAEPFEHEARHLLGIEPESGLAQEKYELQIGRGALLRKPLTTDDGQVAPVALMRDTSDAAHAQCIKKIQQEQALAEQQRQNGLMPGQVNVIVGPTHAEIIESGQFVFSGVGEQPDRLTINHGFKYKGIEQLFETPYLAKNVIHQNDDKVIPLRDGWALAERVCGDSSFAHSLAYCHAVETLLNMKVGRRSTYLRGLFLELERIYNHVGATAALAKDVALSTHAADLFALREWLMQLNERLLGGRNGSRFLRGINRPGGLFLEHALYPIGSNASDGEEADLTARTVIDKAAIDKAAIDKAVVDITQGARQRARYDSLKQLLTAYDLLAERLLNNSSFQRRAQDVGVFYPGANRGEKPHGENPGEERASLIRGVTRIGATGFVARASGVFRDFRIQHPSGIYRIDDSNNEDDTDTRERIRSYVIGAWKEDELLETQQFRGDVYSRLLLRRKEVQASQKIIEELLDGLAPMHEPDESVPASVYDVDNSTVYPFAFGYAEGWRGEVIYFVMRDAGSGIFRCKVRDPSFLNWLALEIAVAGEQREDSGESGSKAPSTREKGSTAKAGQGQAVSPSILADFPLINKSFDLSYSAYDG